jgi:hypothetical protein
MKKVIGLAIFALILSLGLVFNTPSVSAQTAGAGVLTATVNVGNTPDSKIVIAGSTMQKVGSFKFTAQNTSFTIQDLRVKTFGESNNSSISSVTLKYKDVGGLEKTVSQPISFSSTGGLATYTGLSAFIPQNTDRDIDVYVDVSTIASGANSGALIIVSLDSSGGFKAFDSNGTVDTTLASQDLSSFATSGKGTLVVRRSVPILSAVPLDSNRLFAGSNQQIGRVKISANSGGDIGWKKIAFTFTRSSGLVVGSPKLYNLASNTEIEGVFTNPLAGQLIFTASNEEQIASGSSITYDLRATVSGLNGENDYLYVGIANPSVTGVTSSASSVETTGPVRPSFVWTDRSSSSVSGGNVHSLNTLDWTNDYLIKNLPLNLVGNVDFGGGTVTPPPPVTPPVVTPPTTDESALIAQLQALIAQLLEQLKAQGYEIDANGNLVRVDPTPVQPALPRDFCYVWGKNLTIGSTGPDVDALVRAMVIEGFLVRAPGENIQGEDFNEILAEAVVKFQGKYGIFPKSGFVGPVTRAQLGALYGGNCDNNQTPSISNVQLVGGSTVIRGQSYTVSFNSINVKNVIVRLLSPSIDDPYRVYTSPLVSVSDGNNNVSLSIPATFSTGFGTLYVINANNQNVSAMLQGHVNVLPQQDTPVSDATATVTGAPTLELIYDASQKESSLRATFDVTVNGGSKGVKIMVGENVGSFNLFKGANQVYVNSMRVSITALNSSTTAIYADFDSTAGFVVVPMNSSLGFRVVGTVDPRHLFAGEYTARLVMMYARSGETFESDFKIPVVANTSRGGIAITNPKVIVGEVSPYIKSMTNPVVPGQDVDIFGQRLNAFGNTGPAPKVMIDNVVIDLGNSYYNNDGSASGFTAPATLANGRHSLQTENLVTGKSNVVWFDVGDPSLKATLEIKVTSFENSFAVGTVDATIAQITLTARNGDVALGEIISYGVPGSSKVLNRFSLYDGSIKLGEASVNSFSANSIINVPAKVTIAKDTTKVLTLKADAVEAGSVTLRIAGGIGGQPNADFRTIFGTLEKTFVVGSSSTPVGANLSAELLRETGDKAGQWYTFRDDGTKDWVWNMYLNLKSAKRIKAISIRHDSPNRSGEAWSTTASTSLLGKLLYPLVVTTTGGTQLNSVYDQSYAYNTSSPEYGNFDLPAGDYNFKLYGNTGKVPFDGGKIYVDFTDGTSVSSMISASDYNPLSQIASRSITVSRDASSPVANVIAGSTNVPLLVFKLYSTTSGNTNLNGVAVSIPGVSQSALSNIKLYEGTTLVANGIYSSANGVNGGVNGEYSFTAPITITQYYQKTLTIRGDISATASGSITPTLGGIYHDYGTALSVSGLGFSGNTLTITGLVTPPATSLLSVSNNAAYASQNVNPNTTDVKIGSYTLQNQSNSEVLRVTGLGIYIAGTVSISNLSSLRTSETSALGSVPQVANSLWTNFTIAPGATKVIDILANVGSQSGATIVSSLAVTYLNEVSYTSSTSAPVVGQTITLVPVPNPTPTPTTYPMVFRVLNKVNGQPVSGMQVSIGSSASSLIYDANGRRYYIQPLAHAQTTDSSGRVTFNLPPLVGDSYSFVVGNTTMPIVTEGQGGYSGTFTIPFSQSLFDVEVTLPTQAQPVVQSSVSASVSSIYDDRAGRIGVFGAGPGNPAASSRGNANDFVWNVALTLGAEKTIKSITINHPSYGEYWSTVNTSAYPLVVYVGDAKKNNDYGQSLGTYGAGTTNLVIYGQHENPYFTGGNITITFEDNSTPVTANIPASSFSPQVPEQSASAIDAMADILKRMLKR